MAKTLNELYVADATAGEPENITGNELIFFDASPEKAEATSKAMTLTQLNNIINPEPSAGDFTLTMSVVDNSLVANILPITGVTYTHYAIQEDVATAPIIGDAIFIEGAIPLNYVMSDYSQHTYYMWIHDGATVAVVPPNSIGDDGSGGFTLQGNQPDTTLLFTPTIRHFTTTDDLSTILTPGYFDTFLGILRSGDIMFVRVVDGSNVTQKNYTLRVEVSASTVAVEHIYDSLLGDRDSLLLGWNI